MAAWSIFGMDAKGEVLDVLVQSRRNKQAALKFMRKLLKKYGFVPDKLVTDDLRSYAAAASDLGIAKRHERGRWRSRIVNTHARPSEGPVEWMMTCTIAPPTLGASESAYFELFAGIAEHGQAFL
jgi:transposase-like protein